MSEDKYNSKAMPTSYRQVNHGQTVCRQFLCSPNLTSQDDAARPRVNNAMAVCPTQQHTLKRQVLQAVFHHVAFQRNDDDDDDEM